MSGYQTIPSDKSDIGMNVWPEYGDKLTFPVTINPVDAIPIPWSDGGRTRHTCYYRVRGWFRKPWKEEQAETMSCNCNNAREVEVYIAEEFIDPKYRYLVAYLNLMDLGSWKIKFDWVQLTIGEELYYGQTRWENESRRSRFIIYQPRRDIPLERFRQYRHQTFLETMAAELPEKRLHGITILKMEADKAAQLSSLTLAMSGHELYQFTPLEANGLDLLGDRYTLETVNNPHRSCSAMQTY